MLEEPSLNPSLVQISHSNDVLPPDATGLCVIFKVGGDLLFSGLAFETRRFANFGSFPPSQHYMKSLSDSPPPLLIQRRPILRRVNGLDFPASEQVTFRPLRRHSELRFLCREFFTYDPLPCPIWSFFSPSSPPFRAISSTPCRRNPVQPL